MSTSKRLLTGSALRFTSLVANVAIGFFLMPFVIRSLGDRWYGLWVIVGSILGYFGFLDVGLGSATQRFFGTELHRGDHGELNRILNTALTIFCGLGLIALALAGFVVWIGPHFLKSPGEAVAFRATVAIMGGGVSLGFPFYVLTGLLTANLRFDQVSYLQLAKVPLRSVLFVWVLWHGYSVVAMAVVTVGCDGCGYLATAWLARRAAPWMRLRLRDFSLRHVSSLFDFGIYAFLSSIANKIRYGLDDLVLAAFSSMSVVAHYNIAMRLAEYLLQALNSWLSIMTPVFSRSYAERSNDRLREQFLFASRVGACLGSCAGGACVLFGHPFIRLWMGDRYLDAYAPLAILVLAVTIDAMQIPTVNALFAVAKHKFYSLMTIGEAIANVALSLLLVRPLGMVGVAVGTLVPMIVTKLLIQPLYVSHVLGIRPADYFKSVLGPALVLAVVQTPIMLAVAGIRIDSYLELALIGTLSYLVVAALALRFVFTAGERAILGRLLPSGLR